MRDIDDDFLNAVCLQFFERILNHRFARDGYQWFGDAVGHRLQPCAVSGGQHHRLFDFTIHNVFSDKLSNETNNPSPVRWTPSPRPAGRGTGRGAPSLVPNTFLPFRIHQTNVSRRPAWGGAGLFATAVPRAVNG